MSHLNPNITIPLRRFYSSGRSCPSVDRVRGLSDGRESSLRSPLRESMDGVRRGVDEDVHGNVGGYGSKPL